MRGGDKVDEGVADLVRVRVGVRSRVGVRVSARATTRLTNA